MLALLGICLVAGCGGQREPAGNGRTSSHEGVIVTGGVLEPVPAPPPNQRTPWHPPIHYYALRPDGTGARNLAGFSHLDFELDFSADGELR